MLDPNGGHQLTPQILARSVLSMPIRFMHDGHWGVLFKSEGLQCTGFANRRLRYAR